MREFQEFNDREGQPVVVRVASMEAVMDMDHYRLIFLRSGATLSVVEPYKEVVTVMIGYLQK